MAVARNIADSVTTNTLTTVVEITASSRVKLKGFLGSGTCEAWWTLYINGEAQFDYMTSAADRNAYVLFPDIDIASGTIIQLRVNHQHPQAQNFRGSLIYA